MGQNVCNAIKEGNIRLEKGKIRVNIVIGLMLLIIGLVVVDIDRKISLFVMLLDEISEELKGSE